MNKQQLIDKAIEDLGGDKLWRGDYLYLIFGGYSSQNDINPNHGQYVCTRKEFEDRVEELKAKSKWNGKGLPPVGVELLWLSPNTGVYHHTKIIHINDESAWLEGEGVVSHDLHRYKPIQTEREKVIEKACDIMVSHMRFESGFHQYTVDDKLVKSMAKLYDAGMLTLPI